MATLERLREVGITSISADTLAKLEQSVCPRCGENLNTEKRIEKEHDCKTGPTLFACSSCRFVYEADWY